MKKILPNRKIVKYLVITFVVLFSLELVLRFLVGLGDLALYREDDDYEYFYKSNQNVWRFGNQIITNEFGMRSNELDKKKQITILEFGDSVLNGGAHIDQDNLATYIEERILNEKFNNQVQVLNVSAQSWGVSNAYAYLKKHGDFNASIIVLVFSSHDLHDNMHFRKVVGVHSAWPNEKPMLAITDAWVRFVWPSIERFFGYTGEYNYLKNFDDSKINTGWQEFINYSHANNIPLIVYLHGSKPEIYNSEYNGKGLEIIRICNKEKIQIITDLDALKGVNDAFIDDIHMNEVGHKIMSSLLVPVLEKKIRESQTSR